ncbi:COP9 signalosome complex subunit 1 [Hyphodiscus hymeniophilus]|uniref:COP9 signalosome complex subunit 1 n=1 Tax=Hyphodiscus hymeniophilus TaxID=353542 RepID=A0A9P6VFI3_9HELO|nr:COP9 signalosome complex subunit 1 [Hyphodiscus hymeniophilus]
MAAVTIPPSSPTQSRKKSNIVTGISQDLLSRKLSSSNLHLAGPPKFDLESYIQNYKGRTRLERLLLIGSCSSFLGVDAYKAAVHEAKHGKDIKRYLEAQTPLETIAPQEPEAVRDTQWMDQQSKLNEIQTASLEKQLKEYKNNLVKESIRMGNEDLGKHYQEIGDLPKAFEAYSRMRADAASQKHIIEVSKHLIEVSIEQRNWIGVTSNVQKIKQIQATPDEERSLQPYLCTADGLALMDSGGYYSAALAFLRTDAGMGSSYNTFISPNDVAVYGGLCALASMERSELNRSVLENSNFRTYLELEPNIRRAITFFVNSRYTACLNILESYYSDYLLDIHLQKHVDQLYQLIRSKSIVQYFIPFSCVTLSSLNEAFAAPGKTVDKELVQMIQRKELDARIDTQNRVLTSVSSSSRATLHNEALKTAKEYEREARRRIQHMNIVSADLELKGGKARGSQMGQMGGMDDLFSEGMGGGRELRSRAYIG